MTLRLSTPALIVIVLSLMLWLINRHSAPTVHAPFMPINEADVFGRMDEQANRAGQATWRARMKTS